MKYLHNNIYLHNITIFMFIGYKMRKHKSNALNYTFVENVKVFKS